MFKLVLQNIQSLNMKANIKLTRYRINKNLLRG